MLRKQGEVFYIGGRLSLLAIDGIAETDVLNLLARHAETQDERLPSRGAPVAFSGGELAHAGIRQPGPLGARRFARLGRRGREIAIRHAFVENGLRDCLMDSQPFGLAILLVPSEIQPAQPIENGIERGLRVALDVGVVNAQDHSAAVVTRVEPVENERARTTDVEKAGGRRREANS